ncbi:102aa long hypothetical protein [Pyrococcus horikoshii OT3]|uniref:Uncharacterized protein n=1 Tax=Pyrococcus horikoshii (strain ATCC 700860 / DSM 12428 / JCM 9974 / NBRC 100139 / OT-3) TaxID=70601 RepID=O58385_PYRHO|nr:102aa long hypothetical protein [Pyrococcus horikoshii OT3]
MLITLSLGGMNIAKEFNVVVLPEPVPPATRMFAGLTPRPSTRSQRNAATSEFKVLNFIKSIIVSGSFLNFLIVIVGPSRLIGGNVALTLLPSGSLASRSGFC